jgi:hypothetical protein
LFVSLRASRDRDRAILASFCKKTSNAGALRLHSKSEKSLTARRFCAVFGESAWQPRLPFRLFGLLDPLALAEAHAGAAPVFVDEFDPAQFKG